MVKPSEVPLGFRFPLVSLGFMYDLLISFDLRWLPIGGPRAESLGLWKTSAFLESGFSLLDPLVARSNRASQRLPADKKQTCSIGVPNSEGVNRVNCCLRTARATTQDAKQRPRERELKDPDSDALGQLIWRVSHGHPSLREPPPSPPPPNSVQVDSSGVNL